MTTSSFTLPAHQVREHDQSFVVCIKFAGWTECNGTLLRPRQSHPRNTRCTYAMYFNTHGVCVEANSLSLSLSLTLSTSAPPSISSSEYSMYVRCVYFPHFPSLSHISLPLSSLSLSRPPILFSPRIPLSLLQCAHSLSLPPSPSPSLLHSVHFCCIFCPQISPALSPCTPKSLSLSLSLSTAVFLRQSAAFKHRSSEQGERMHWLKAEHAIAEMAVASPRTDEADTGGRHSQQGYGIGGGIGYSPGSLSLSHLNT